MHAASSMPGVFSAMHAFFGVQCATGLIKHWPLFVCRVHMQALVYHVWH